LTITGRAELPPLTWSKVGTGFFFTSAWGSSWPLDLYQSNELSMFYLLRDVYVDGYDIQFILKNDAIIYENWIPTGWSAGADGMIFWINPVATAASQPRKEGNVFYFDPRFVVSDGRGWGQWTVSLTIDE